MDEFFTVYEASKMIKVHPITIRRYIREGKLKAVKVAGNIRIAKSSFISFTENFVQNLKSNKSPIAMAKQANFSFDDPIFRLKARGLGIKNDRT